MARVLRKSFSSLEWTAFTLFTLDDGIMMLIPEAWERWAGMWWWWWTGLEQIISYPKIMTSSTLYFIRRTPAAVQQSILTEIQQSNCCWLTVNCDWWNSSYAPTLYRRRNSMEKALTIYMKINLLILSLGIRIQSEALFRVVGFRLILILYVESYPFVLFCFMLPMKTCEQIPRTDSTPSLDHHYWSQVSNDSGWGLHSMNPMRLVSPISQ